MESKKYATAAALRRALEDRLKDIAGKQGVDLQRLRRQVAFDRLLARLFQGTTARATLGAERRLRDGAANQGRAHDEGY